MPSPFCRFVRRFLSLALVLSTDGVAHAVMIAQGGAGSTEGAHASPAMVDGHPAIAWLGNNRTAIRYVRAADPAGLTWNPPVVVAPGSSAGFSLVLRTVAGSPAICYFDFALQKLKFVRATDLIGSAWAPPVVIETASPPALQLAMEIVDGNPAIAFTGGSAGDLIYIRAADAAGTTWHPAVKVDLSGGYSDVSLKIADGRPAIAYSSAGGLFYRRAADSAGSAWGTRVTVSSSQGGSRGSLQIVDGRPAVSYFQPGSGALMYVKAADAAGDSWLTPSSLSSNSSAGEFSSLAVVDGRPAIGYYEGGFSADLKYIQAKDASASAWNPGMVVASMGDVGQYPTLFDVNGTPALVYHHATRGSLHYLRAADQAPGAATQWPPEIVVEQPPGTFAPPGATVNFGTVVVGSPESLSFTLKGRPGSVSLVIQSMTIEGVNAAEFSISDWSAVAPGSSQFRVTCSPVAAGVKTAALRIVSNGDTPVYDIALTADSSPFISVEQPVGTSHTDGGKVFIPVTAPGRTRDVVFSVWNRGGSELNSLALTIDGPHAAEFSIAEAPAVSVAPDTSVAFTLRHVPLTEGGKTVHLHIASNVAGTQNPFDLTINTVPGVADETFDPAAGTGILSFLSLAVRANGKILAGGENSLSSFNPDGSQDPAFFAPPVSGGSVRCIAVQKDGSFLIGGDFERVGARDIESLARVFPDGTVDESFDPGMEGSVHCVAVQPDGRIIVGGLFFRAGGVNRRFLARLFPDGSLDAGFTAVPNDDVKCIDFQPGGGILVGGSFTEISGSTTPFFARLNIDGTGNAFPANLRASVTSIAVQPDGKVFAGGPFPFSLVRLLPDLTVDPSPLPLVYGNVNDLVTQADGKCLIAGDFLTVGGSPHRAIARLNSDGSVDEAFVADANAPVRRLAVQADGCVLLAGEFTSVGGASHLRLARVYSDSASIQLSAGVGSVRWLFGGTAPAVRDIFFAFNSNNSLDWTPLGPGEPVPGGWEWSGLTLPSGGTLRAQARAGGSVIESAIPLLPPIERWRLQYFDSSSDTGPGADGADPDQDGLTNLIEFSFGLSPVSTGSAALPEFKLNGTLFTASFTSPPGTDEIRYGAEWSATMEPGAWTAIPDTGTGRNHVFSIPASHRRAFARFVIKNR